MTPTKYNRKERRKQRIKKLRAAAREKAQVKSTAKWTRLVAIVPAIGFFFSSLVLAFATLGDVFMASLSYLQGGHTLLELATTYIKHADIFLLAVVLNILALGLVTLFITDKLQLPEWLKFDDLDDLKERLVSVIGVMLAVYFLGYVLEGAGGLDVLWMGLGCAVTLVGMAIFVRSVFNVHEDHDALEAPGIVDVHSIADAPKVVEE
jgi:uncharacterized membrane protein YqhA